MAKDLTSKILRQLKPKVQKFTPIATDMFLPNHSGDHSAGTVRETPTDSLDIVNKSYVDAQITAVVQYSDEKVDDRVAVLIQNGTGITWSYDDVNGTLTPTVTITQYTDALAKTAAVSDAAYGVGWNGVTDVAPSKNAVYDKIESLPVASIDGSGTLNEITYWVDSNTLGALAVATYPSLTELSYVKGVTSAIQTQLNGKQASGSYALTTGNLSQFAATTSLQLKGVISDETGSGALCFATSPTLVTPALGTPASGTLTNCTGLPITGITSSTSAQFATLCSDETGSGKLVFATTPTLTTPVLGVATATSINFGQDALNYYDEGTFTPTITLVGGSGNTVPTYGTNTGIYTRIGRAVYCQIYLFNGTGGTAGAGTGVMNIALPFTASASSPARNFMIGSGYNSPNYMLMTGRIAGATSTISLGFFSSFTVMGDVTGNDQSADTRFMRLEFWYNV